MPVYFYSRNGSYPFDLKNGTLNTTHMTPLSLQRMTGICLILVAGSLSLHAQSKPWPVPSTYEHLRNPLPVNAAEIREGARLYKTNCSACHGNNGKGDGPAAASLHPRPADHTSAAVQSETDGSLFYKLSEGRTPMPGFKSSLNPTQRWQLIEYIRTLGKARG